MSEARNQRFDIDIEEIERQLRHSAEQSPAARPDPLAELARIVGQDDPFRGILGDARGAVDRSNVHVLNRPTQEGTNDAPAYAEGDRAAAQDTVAHLPPPARDGRYDPVADTYGSAEDAFAQDDLQPLQPRRSRGRLVAVMAALLVAGGAVAGGVYWRKTGGSFTASGDPPVITADKTPLKVAPENPGGIDVPNQNRQIYERGAADGQSRVIDGREQPLDVREAARGLPPTVSARAPVPSPPGDAGGSRPAGGGNAVSSILGEPRRVHTVAVRPDGTIYTPTTKASVPDAPPSLVPGNTLPAPVPVSTVPVPTRSGPATGPAGAAMPAPVASTPPADTAFQARSPAETAPAGTVTTNVLPPRRPKLDGRKPAAAAEEPTRTASAQPAAAERPAAERPAATAGRTSFVQVAVKPTEDEARTAYSQLQDRFAADLDGKSARVTQAEVAGKTVHRVRVGPMSKDDANALCAKLKSSGGSCFVAN